jgi:hypothetical protein
MLMTTQTDEPTTSDLIEFYSEQHVKLKSLKAELAQVEAVIEGIEEMLLERMPPGIDQMSHVCTTGTKVSIRAKVTERYQPGAGQSDAFWQWAQSNGRWDMASRTVLQAGVKAFIAAEGQLPPGIELVSKTTAGVTVTVGAPRA